MFFVPFCMRSGGRESRGFGEEAGTGCRSISGQQGEQSSFWMTVRLLWREQKQITWLQPLHLQGENATSMQKHHRLQKKLFCKTKPKWNLFVNLIFNKIINIMCFIPVLNHVLKRFNTRRQLLYHEIALISVIQLLSSAGISVCNAWVLMDNSSAHLLSRNTRRSCYIHKLHIFLW